jgi:hypothetical protein
MTKRELEQINTATTEINGSALSPSKRPRKQRTPKELDDRKNKIFRAVLTREQINFKGSKRGFLADHADFFALDFELDYPDFSCSVNANQETWQSYATAYRSLPHPKSLLKFCKETMHENAPAKSNARTLSMAIRLQEFKEKELRDGSLLPDPTGTNSKDEKDEKVKSTADDVVMDESSNKKDDEKNKKVNGPKKSMSWPFSSIWGYVKKWSS